MIFQDFLLLLVNIMPVCNVHDRPEKSQSVGFRIDISSAYNNIVIYFIIFPNFIAIAAKDTEN